MNVIEEKYRYARKVVEVLKELKNSKGKEPPMVIETFHFITPQNEIGISMLKHLNEFQARMEGKGALVLREFGTDVSIEELEDQIAKSINLSKKNIQDMIVKHELVTKPPVKFDLKGNKIIKKLTEDSLPT